MPNPHTMIQLRTYKMNILSLAYWKETKAFKKVLATESQEKYYRRMGAPPEVMDLVALESKSFGTKCEHLLAEIFGLGIRTRTQNDATLNGIKIEIKCARYWGGKDDCKWQHLEPEHDYQYLLAALLHTDGTWRVWGVSKKVLMGEMRDRMVVVYQGKQGWWFNKNSGLPYLTPIHSREDLLRAIASVSV